MQIVIRAALVIIGVTHLLVTGLTFAAPGWFFTYIAPFHPFNGHFLADIGAFNAPLGVGLLVAARAPARHRLLIGLAALGNLLHAASHVRDGHLHVPPAMPLALGLTTQLATLLAGVALLLIAVYGAMESDRAPVARVAGEAEA